MSCRSHFHPSVFPLPCLHRFGFDCRDGGTSVALLTRSLLVASGGRFLVGSEPEPESAPHSRAERARRSPIHSIAPNQTGGLMTFFALDLLVLLTSCRWGRTDKQTNQTVRGSFQVPRFRLLGWGNPLRDGRASADANAFGACAPLTRALDGPRRPT